MHRLLSLIVLGVVLVVGAVYYLVVQRKKPSHLEAPAGEAFAAEA